MLAGYDDYRRDLHRAAQMATANHGDDFPEDARARARALIAEALETDRKTVAHIEVALTILDTSE